MISKQAPMRILYDAQMFTWQNYGGITRYFYELASRFYKDPELHISLSILLSDNYYIRNCSFAKHWRGAQNLSFKGKMSAYRLINQIYNRYKVPNIPFDLLHPTYYNPYFLKCLKGRPYIITVFDLIHELYPDTLAANQKTVRKWKRTSILKADLLIAISESTKRDLMSIYGLHASKIHVVPLAASLSGESSAHTGAMQLPCRYVVYVGARSAGYKNFETLAQAFQLAGNKDKGLYLVCVGGGPFSSSEARLFARLGISDKVRQMSISDKEMFEMYSRARLLVYPSLYEGFGIPLLEAFTCGCPAAVSNSSSLPEVGGDACLYFDPGNAGEMAEKIGTLVEDGKLRDSLIEKGLRQARKFSWDSTAASTKQIYFSLISGSTRETAASGAKHFPVTGAST
jgi:glycosyltransferase involved in cell wall biosynthesis